MNILIRDVGKFKEVTVRNGDVLVDIGLLDNQEAIELARELISAAAILIPFSHDWRGAMITLELACREIEDAEKTWTEPNPTADPLFFKR